MSSSQTDPFEILKNSILSRPRMMGSKEEIETTAFLLDFLTKRKLNPYTEEIQWSTAFVEGRKYLYLIMAGFVILFNLSLRIASPWNGFLSILLVILSILTFIFFMKGLFHDKFDTLGKSSVGKNVICTIEAQEKKKEAATIYFTAHYDSISSNHPKLSISVMMGILLGSLISILLTTAESILHLVNYFEAQHSFSSAISILNLILMIFSAIVLVCVVFSRFLRNVNRGPGAVDNGSGSAILLSLAAYFKDHPLPHTRLKFIWCAAEEWGLYGSKGYVKTHKEEIAAACNTSCVINVDMVGSELAYLDKSGLLFKKPLNKKLNTLIAQTAKETEIEARPFYSPLSDNSDHAAFQKEKVDVCFFLANKDSKFIHSPQDTIDKVKPEKLNDAVELIKRMVVKLDKGWK